MSQESVEIQRYRCSVDGRSPGMDTHPEGKYVLYSEHVLALRAERERAEQCEEACKALQEGKPLGPIVEKHTIQNMLKELAALKAENERLKHGECEHIGQDALDGNCKLCELAVADKGYTLWVEIAKGLEIELAQAQKPPTVDGIPWYDFLSRVQKELAQAQKNLKESRVAYHDSLNQKNLKLATMREQLTQAQRERDEIWQSGKKAQDDCEALHARLSQAEAVLRNLKTTQVYDNPRDDITVYACGCSHYYRYKLEHGKHCLTESYFSSTPSPSQGQGPSSSPEAKSGKAPTPIHHEVVPGEGWVAPDHPLHPDKLFHGEKPKGIFIDGKPFTWDGLRKLVHGWEEANVVLPELKTFADVIALAKETGKPVTIPASIIESLSIKHRALNAFMKSYEIKEKFKKEMRKPEPNIEGVISDSAAENIEYELKEAIDALKEIQSES